MNKRKVQYMDSIRRVGGDNLPKYKYKEVDSSFVKCYYSMYASLVGLNPCSRDLMDYLTEIMDNDNIVRSDSYVRTKFSNYLKSISLKDDGTFVSYADSNVKKAFQTLVDRGCLIKLSKGIFKVNPEIYFRKTETLRMKSIKVTMEFIKGVRDAEMKLMYELKEDPIVILREDAAVYSSVEETE